ncbi:MAG: prepilin-type N-terminal cleavage/methylation domain-containing protein [Synergistes sp.]|nr:prepilin-type N-terminal cleavage/methylation domain-containing protein [Synergistes sp.]
MLKKYRKAKGFTLVELLIVIVIIGILAGMMMLTTGSATDKAEATKIIANLRGLKAAALMCYADENAWPTDIASLDKYVDQSIGETSDYEVGDEGEHLYVAYGGDKLTAGVKDKLATMAEEVGLKAGAASADFTKDSDSVGMMVK